MAETAPTLTLHNVEHQEPHKNALGGDLDPPLAEQGEEHNPHDAFASQRRPGDFGLGFGKRRASVLKGKQTGR